MLGVLLSVLLSMLLVLLSEEDVMDVLLLLFENWVVDVRDLFGLLLEELVGLLGSPLSGEELHLVVPDLLLMRCFLCLFLLFLLLVDLDVALGCVGHCLGDLRLLIDTIICTVRLNLVSHLLLEDVFIPHTV